MIGSDVRAYIFDRDGHQCRRCQERRHLCIDHVLPKSYMLRCGAPESAVDATWNLQTLCHGCNDAKGVSIPSPRYIARIRELDAKHQRSAQMRADRDIEELRQIPEVADIFAVWEHLLDCRQRDHDEPAVLEMPQYWELDVLDLIEAGATQDDLYTAADAAVSPTTTSSAWGYFLTVVRSQIQSRSGTAQLLLFKRDGKGRTDAV